MATAQHYHEINSEDYRTRDVASRAPSSYFFIVRMHFENMGLHTLRDINHYNSYYSDIFRFRNNHIILILLHAAYGRPRKIHN